MSNIPLFKKSFISGEGLHKEKWKNSYKDQLNDLYKILIKKDLWKKITKDDFIELVYKNSSKYISNHL